MTTGELIDLLQQMPSDTEIWRGYKNSHHSTDVVRKVETPHDLNWRLRVNDGMVDELIIEACGWSFGGGQYVGIDELALPDDASDRSA